MRWLRLDIEGDADRLLFGAGVGFAALEVLLFLAQLGRNIPIAFGVVLALGGILGAREFPGLLRSIRHTVDQSWSDSRWNLLLSGVALIVLLIEGLAAMAPVTGSDALHYHFATELSLLQTGFAPDFSISHSFLTGQGHLLILLGLAFHSEKLALGLLYCGGVLAAAATTRLVRAWAPREYAWLAAIAFLVTPVVFWQISSAGTPDLWMAFFSAIGVLAIAKFGASQSAGFAAVCGLCAGITAGTKYTGCIVATTLFLAFVWATHNFRPIVIFVGAALGAGIWPYARNLVWTGDPVFPFALHWFRIARVNSHALSALLADTGAKEQIGLTRIIQFPFFAAIDAKHLGFWQFFGPLCLLFGPMFIWMVRRTTLWRTSLLVWIGSSIGVGISSGMLRFLLPVFPIALAAAFGGLQALCQRSSEWVRRLAMASVIATVCIGLVGLPIYTRAALAAGTGFVSREDYLRKQAPEYESAEFINNTIASFETTDRTLVFLRHLYYLRIPYTYGDPDGSWLVDLDRLQTTGDWLAFFRQNRIRWVARAEKYPGSIAAPLTALEAQGILVPVARGEVNEFSGMRILDSHEVVKIVVFEVKE
jgi:hypothetical protein